VPAVPGPPVPRTQATLTWIEQALPADPGHLLQQASFGQATLIDTALGVTPGGGAVTHTGIAIPAGTQTLLVIGTDQTFFAGGGHVDLTGEVTNETYFGSEPFPTSPSTVPVSGILYFPAIPVDTTVKVIYDAVAAVRVNFWMFALPTVPAVSVINEIKTVLMDSLGSLLSTPTELAADPLLGVTLSGANPAPWQAPRSVVTFNASIASGGNSIIIAAAGGVTLYLHHFTIGDDGANAAARYHFQDTTGADLDIYVTTNVRGIKAVGSFGGLKLTTGRGVRILQAGAAASFISGKLTYTAA
jgi:hypothetical protein